MLYKSLLLVSSLFLFCCKSNQSVASQETNKEVISGSQGTNNDVISDSQEQSQALPPEFCRIIGKVISVKSSIKEANGDSLCENHPCEAEVMIEKVLGYGSSFPEMLYPKEVINVYFAFTLQKTKEVFPNKDVIDLPGLKEGNKFEANMEGSLLKGEYTIYEYVVIK